MAVFSEVDIEFVVDAPRDPNPLSKSVRASRLTCLRILYWVLGLHMIFWVGKGKFSCFLHASCMVLCIRVKSTGIEEVDARTDVCRPAAPSPARARAPFPRQHTKHRVPSTGAQSPAPTSVRCVFVWQGHSSSRSSRALDGVSQRPLGWRGDGMASVKAYPRAILSTPGYLRLPPLIQTGTQRSTPQPTPRSGIF